MNVPKPSGRESDISLILYVPGLKLLTVSVSAKSKIESLRRVLTKKLREENFHLVYEDFVLDDSSTISNYNLHDNSVIRVSSDLRENLGFVTDRLVLAANPVTKMGMFRLLDLEMTKLEQRPHYYKGFIMSNRFEKDCDSYFSLDYDFGDREDASKSSLPLFWL